MPGEQKIILYHAPNTRSSGVLFLLQELGASYELKIINRKAGEQRQPAYLAVNPMGKVPAVTYGDALITEQVAIFLYLADLFPQAKLAPAIADPLRGPYLRWLAFYGSAFEPAITDLAMKREPTPPVMCPYGDYDTMLATLTARLRAGPYLLGERFSAADVLWGSSLVWATMFKLVPALPEVMAYIDRVGSRPAVRRAAEADAALAAAQG
jgi:glutathione S-transferase